MGLINRAAQTALRLYAVLDTPRNLRLRGELRRLAHANSYTLPDGGIGYWALTDGQRQRMSDVKRFLGMTGPWLLRLEGMQWWEGRLRRAIEVLYPPRREPRT